MQTFRPFVVTLLCGCLPVLAACSSSQSSSSGGLAASIDGTVTTALDNAQAKLRSEPITVSHNDSTLPKAEITPSGDFVVGGKTVAITPAQRNALLEYRSQMIAVASAGIAVGKQGAALGLHAASTAIAAALSGKSDAEIQKQVQTQASGIRQAAARICARLPAMMTEQQKLAAILPEFKPYATMTGKDISDCRTDALHDDDPDQAQVQGTIRDSIRDGIRSGTQAVAQGTGLASSGARDAGNPAKTSGQAQH